jgi:hypothetical protein
MALPTFLCIGATKAGTTWLHDQLSVHPAVNMPVIKELHYFNTLYVPEHDVWAPKAVRRSIREALQRARQDPPGQRNRPLIRHLRGLLDEDTFTEAWYRRCFERPGHEGKVSGEITPAYAELPETGIRNVLALLPDVRIIYILRHPFDRAMSHLRMDAFRSETPAEASALMDLLASNGHILSRGDYAQHLPRWQAALSTDRLLVLPFGMIRSNPAELMARVEGFLGLPAFEKYPLSSKVNKTRSIDVPTSVVEYIRDQVEPQVQYILNTFGPAFLEATR